MSRLSLSKVEDLTNGQDIRQVKRLFASERKIKYLDDLSPCLELQRIDLSHNLLTSFKGIVDCTSLTWLNLAHNYLESLDGIHYLTNLVVLNASHNIITSSGNLAPLKNLKALILNNNQLTIITGLSSLHHLNTLVLSHNQFEFIDITKLTELTKLSISHNNLHSIPDTKSNLQLLELRLNNNKVTTLPDTLRLNTKVHTMDLGHNKLQELNFLKVLCNLAQLKTFNLKGNPICTEQNIEKIIKWLPQVIVLNGMKVTSLKQQRPVKRHTDTTMFNVKKRKIEEAEVADITISTTEILSPQSLPHNDIVTPQSIDIAPQLTLRNLSDDLRIPISHRRRQGGSSGVISIQTVKSSSSRKKRKKQKDNPLELVPHIKTWD